MPDEKPDHELTWIVLFKRLSYSYATANIRAILQREVLGMLVCRLLLVFHFGVVNVESVFGLSPNEITFNGNRPGVAVSLTRD